MKKSEFKEYLKTEILKMGEATQKDVDLQSDLNDELEKTRQLQSDMMEGEGSTITLDDKDMEMLHKNGKLDIDDHTVLYKMKEGKMKKSEFKEYLKNEILAEMNEQEEDIELGDLEGEEEITTSIAEPEQDKALELDDIGDTLVQLARRAKDADERDLATQILNSAKFAKKTEFKKVEKDAGIGEEGE
jgi:hypothetical protein